MTNLSRELIEAVVGAVFIAIGLAGLLAAITARPRRERTVLWFGVFCILYGIRLAARSHLVHVVTAWPGAVFEYTDAFVTYAILVPCGLFIETLVGRGWHQAVRRTWQATCVYAVAAIANDLAQGRPSASMWLNAPAVLLSLMVYVPHVAMLARRSRWSTQLRAVVATLTLFTAVVIYETIAQHGVFGGELQIEPFAMLLLTAALGWFVLTRAREQEHAYVALSRELQLARDIQRSLLPRQMPAVPGLSITGVYLPMNAVAGDFYDVATLADQRVIVLMADVSGHGVPAALVASMVKLAFAVESERNGRPGQILASMNRTLTGKFERAYVTACCIVVDRHRQTLAYASAGHPPSLLRRLDGQVESLNEGGIAMTLLPTADYVTTEVPFRPGDRLLVFTDGLTEAARGEDIDEFFGDAELLRVITSVPSSADLTHEVMNAHRTWIGQDTPLSDDVSVVVVECLDVGHRPPGARD